jgi:hypothetical protein
MTPLAERARWLFYLQAFARLLLVWLPASVVLGVGLALTTSPWAGLLGGGALLFFVFLMAVWYPSLAFDRWGYEINETEVLIARGVLVRRVTAIPLNRIQHVDTRQGVLEQWLGLARVQVFTASGIGGDGVIPGLDLDVAEGIRDRLVRVKAGDDGV